MFVDDGDDDDGAMRCGRWWCGAVLVVNVVRCDGGDGVGVDGGGDGLVAMVVIGADGLSVVVDCCCCSKAAAAS